MNRRDLLVRAAGAALLGVVPLRAARAGDAWAAAFEAALARTPWLIGWRDGREQDVARVELSGRLPAELAGTLYRNGPARHAVGGVRYRHWFDGDGMVHAWRLDGGRLDGGRVAYRSRFVRTRKLEAETRAGRPLVPAFGTMPDGLPAVVAPGAMNPANIAVLPLPGEILALWEAGGAYALDPDTLETRGEKAWRDDLRGVPFSAHPKVEPDGTVWNFGVAYPEGRIHVWHIGPDGNVKRFAATGVSHPGMLHDFAVTGRHLVFLLAPFTLDAEAYGRVSFLDAHRWNADAPLRVVAVEKDAPSRHRTWELPAGFAFHFGNAWEERDGTIRFDTCVAADPGVVTGTLRAIMRGERHDGAPSRATVVALRPDGRVEAAVLGLEASEFPRVDPRRVGLRHRQHVHLVRPEGAPWLSTVVRRDLEGGGEDRFAYGPDHLAEEHLFVPRPGSTAEGDGWVLGTVLDTGQQRTGLSVFDARRLADGPVAQAWLDGPLPLGLHGAFAAA